MITPELHHSRFMQAARCEPADTTPVWLMRQAGRYLPEYTAIRSKVTFLELCKRPDLAAEVTLTAQRVLGTDAAILFADLLPILEPMGFHLEYRAGDGPVICNPLRCPEDIRRIKSLSHLDDVGFVFETIRLVRRDLPVDVPLLGFAGAPFTLASYVVEGGGSRHFVRTKKLMYRHPQLWNDLLDLLVESLAQYVKAQIASGCQAVQLFDSWAGCLSPQDYRRYALPHTQALFSQLPPDVPVIHFLTGNPALLPLQREAGGTVMGVDWRSDLGQAWQLVGTDVAVQGNLDPAALFAELPTLKEQIQSVLDAAAGRPGHIFNLGHGVLPSTDPQNVKTLVQLVHELGAR